MTSNGTVEMMTPFPDAEQTGANPPLTQITQFSGASGRVFTNQVDGTAFAPGSTIRSVGTLTFLQALNGDNLPAFLPDGTPMEAIFAIEGTILSPEEAPGLEPGVTAARFTVGSVFLTSRITGAQEAFRSSDPSSWSLGNVFAKYDLLPQSNVVDGTTLGISKAGLVTAPAAATNVSSLNTFVGAVDGIFLFGEDLNFVPSNTFVNPGLGSAVGSNWLRNIVAAPGLPIASEGIASFTDQTVLATTLATFDTKPGSANPGIQPLDSNDLAVLNAIGNAAGFSGLFATGLGGLSASNYNPTSLGVGTGDFIGDLSSEAYLGYQAAQTASIGDRVWHDLNANGIQENGEPGIDGVGVRLYDSGNNLVASTTTAGGGQYLFSGLTPGEYHVEFDAIPGYVRSPQDQGGNDDTDSDANASGVAAVTTLDAGETDLSWDAGYYQTASIGDFVWNDLNANGIQDNGEPGIDGVGVRLYDGAGNLVATTTTASGGMYLFSGLTPGNYHVEFDTVPGFVRSPQDEGGDDGKDSDANLLGIAAVTALISGETDLTWDAGYFQPAINIVKLTNGTDNDSPTGPFVPVGSTVTWTYLVTNPTLVSLANVTVTDNQAGVNPAPVTSGGFNVGDADTDSLLDNGETWQFTASGIAVAGQYANIGTVVGTPVTPTGATIAGAPNVSDDNPDHYFGATAGINIVKLTNGTDNNSPTGPVVPVGSTVTFTYIVTNTGNTQLASVAVTDDNGTPGNTADDFLATFVGGDNDNDNRLDVTETWTYTATRIATAGQYENFGTVTGNPVDQNGTNIPGLADQTDTDIDHHFGAAPAINIVKLTNGTDNNSPTGPVVPVGSTVTFTYIVTNTGNVPLSNIVVTDDNGTPGTTADDFLATFVGGDTNSNNLLDLTETWTFTAGRIATAGQYENFATVTGQDGNGTKVNDTDVDHHFGATAGIDIVKLTNGMDNNTPTGPVVPVGSTVTFTYIVTNTGNTPLAGVVVKDDNGTPGNTGDDFLATFVSGDTDNDGLLDVTETWTYTASRIATAGQYENFGTVTGNPVDENGNDIPGLRDQTDTDVDHHFGATPAINLVKLTNGTDNNSPTGPVVPVGSTVTFTYLVTNAGNVPLSNVVVTDDNGTPSNTLDDFNATFVGGDTNSNNLLDLTETWTFTASRIATAGQYENFGTVTGRDQNGTNVNDTDVDHHFGATAGIDIIKLTNGTDNNSPPGPVVAVGSTVTFTYIVRNTGNTPLAGVVVKDDNGTPGSTADDFLATFIGGDVDNDSRLDVTETWTYTASRIATAGQYENFGTVTGNPVDENGNDIPGLPDQTDTDVDHHFGATPAINIVKLTNGTDNNSRTGPVVPVGSTVTFTYIVTNPGNVPLSNVVVKDDNGTPGNTGDDFFATFVSGDTDNDGLLDVTETWTYTASRIATAGQYENFGTVTGKDVTGTTVTDTDVDHHFGAAAGINIVKLTNGTDNNSPTGPVVAVGSTVTFTYIVTNTGNTPLGGVVVKDDNGTPSNTADDFFAIFVGGDTDNDGRLDVTETWTYTASRIATAGQYVNYGTVTGNPVDENGNDIPGLPDQTDTDIDHHKGVVTGIDLEKLVKIVRQVGGGGEGLTPGFWKTHSEYGPAPLKGWPETGYDPDDSYEAVFGVNVAGTPSLLDALGTGGGGVNALLRHSTAALLNAANPNVDYAYTVAQVIAATQAAILSGNASLIESTKNQFAQQNELGADLSTPAVGGTFMTEPEDADEPNGPQAILGDQVVFIYEVTNTGDVALTNVTVSDVPLGAVTNLVSKGNGDAILDVGEKWVYTLTITATNTGVFRNDGTVTAIPVGIGGTVTDTDPAHYHVPPVTAGINIVKLTNGTDNNSPTGPVVAVGSTVTFTYIVTNTGNTQLANIVVTDNQGVIPVYQSGDTDNDSRLDVNETWTYTATTIASAGQYVNIGTVTGNPVDENGNDIPGLPNQTDSDIDYHFGGKTGIDLEKLVQIVRQVTDGGEGLTPGFWKNHSEYGPAPLKGWPETGYDPDDSYNAIFGVSVSGNPTLLQALGTGGGGINALLRHSTAALLNAANPYVDYQYSLEEVIDKTKAAILSGNATLIEATKNEFAAQNELGADLSTVDGPTYITVPEDADEPNGPLAMIGDQVTFIYEVTNTGDVALYNVVVTDDPLGAVINRISSGNGDNVLDVGEKWVYTLTVTATTTGVIRNEGKVEATTSTGAKLTDTDPAHYHVTPLISGFSSLSGTVYVDKNDNGQLEFGETAISGVEIRLTGTDDLGAVTRTVYTDDDGVYMFLNLRPGTYTIVEVQPSGYVDGKDTVGSLGTKSPVQAAGVISATDDVFREIAVNGVDGIQYNFGERVATISTGVKAGQAATIGFWHNKNGQALLKSLNGSATSTALGNWLAQNFGNMFGHLAGKTNTYIADYYQSAFKAKGQKLDAQVLAVAFAVYVTDSDLAGSVASNYGFKVDSKGLGSATYNIGTSGAAFDVANYTTLSVWDILKATNKKSANGLIYKGDAWLRNLANLVYTGINEQGDI